MSAMAIGIGLYIIPVGMIIHPEIVTLNDFVFALIFTLKIAAGITVCSYGLISRVRFWSALDLCFLVLQYSLYDENFARRVLSLSK